MTELTGAPPSNTAGSLGFLLGAIALVLVLVTFVAGPFGPQTTAGATIGEIAGEAGKGMLRNWLGMEQPTVQRTRSIDEFLSLGVVIAGALAVLLGLFALLRGERRAIATTALASGVSAVAIQLFVATVGLILGALVLCAIILAIGALLGGGF